MNSSEIDQGDGPSGQLALAAAALGLTLSSQQVEGLLRYLDLLQRWNGTYNLTAIRDEQGMVSHHLVDCLAIVGPLRRRLDSARAGMRILDAGSGGGLPGVLLALMHPCWEVICADAVGKKVAFVRQVAGELGLTNLHAVHTRLEQYRAAPFDLVTARAFASLPDLVRLTSALLKPGGCWMAMKGQVPADEVAALPREIEVFHVEPLTVPGLDAHRCLVWMRRRSDS